MASSTASRKAKGRRLQDHVKKVIMESFPALEEGDVKPAIMGESGKDIHLSPAAKRKFNFAVECKNQEKLNIWSSLKQCEENTDDGSKGLLIFKRNHSKTYACLELDDLMAILKELDELRSA
jgi:hypothetical protein